MAPSFIRNQPDFVLGLLYILAGGGFAAAASRYDMGTLAYMGPGYFPFILGMLLAAIGAWIVLRAVLIRGVRVRLASWNLRSLSWMVGSVVMFGLALQPLGLVIALVLLVILASLASHEFTWKTTLINAAVMVVLNVGGFVYGLSIPFPVLPQIAAFQL
ncbi:MAG: tripartite tricarboxylate transporter TctB family protein [Alcaligenaceae bacterium]|nr:tripartite tricarboxylate transporter TctB family protein [Alcaligenaceae bacterium SAGV5]MPS52579.1 tripartite tricarboxylate transporter TctB family protein [Alcaligenaceae bacterium SAGV3]MPT60338.1 tripartite tricarboxylate transporter TctB family protein [Alcaligenaceae bacterium]